MSTTFTPISEFIWAIGQFVEIKSAHQFTDCYKVLQISTNFIVLEEHFEFYGDRPDPKIINLPKAQHPWVKIRQVSNQEFTDSKSLNTTPEIEQAKPKTYTSAEIISIIKTIDPSYGSCNEDSNINNAWYAGFKAAKESMILTLAASG